MKCPKCGYERQSRDDAFVPMTECPACGIIYSKHDNIKAPENTGVAVTASHLKPSPLDPESLKKARERVEKRLRERLETRVHDERHAQTLELAKRFTAERIRKHSDEQLPAPGSSRQEDAPREAEMVLNQEMEAESPEKDQIAAATDTLDIMPETVQAATEATARQESAETEEAGADEPREAAIDAETVEEEAVLLEDIVVVSPDQPQQKPEEAATATGATDEITTETPAAAEEEPCAVAHVAPAASQRSPGSSRPAGLCRFFPMVAWIILLAGVIGAVLSWTTIGDVEAGIRMSASDTIGALPMGLLLGFAYLATGVLGFAFFWVSSLISTQLKDIRQLLLVRPVSTSPSEDE